MLPRKLARLLCALLLLVAAAWPLRAQSIRYHFGDNPRWADPAFDDSSWPVAANAGWPPPKFNFDGFMWVRLRVPVPAISGSLAIGFGKPALMHADEAFVNGTKVGSFGRLPPRAQVELPRPTVFDIAAGDVAPGQESTVALRLWYPPAFRQAVSLKETSQIDRGSTGGLDGVGAIEIGEARVLLERQALQHDRAILRNIPGLVVNILMFLVGVALLLVWYSHRDEQIFLSGALLIFSAAYVMFFQLVGAELLSLTLRQYAVVAAVLCLPGMMLTVEFIWRVHGLNGVGWKRTAWIGLLLFNFCNLVRFLPFEPSLLAEWSSPVCIAALILFNAITFTANLWVLLVKRRNRLIAGSMALIPLCSSLTVIPSLGKWNFFALASEVAMVCLSVVLALRAWQLWRTRDALEAEFEAAREAQERLVTSAVDVPGFAVESAYFPAAHVGGDFFFVRGETDGSLLAVIGDVSGKGLRAALTVSAVVGALRTMPVLPPARILGHLNQGLSGQLGGGFVTCCALRIEVNGTATIANAGHLPPYRNGAEVFVEPGLPLGIEAGAEYSETRFAMHIEDRLTLVSDGVVEARAGSGELFGFERTRAMSDAKAEEIAGAALRFGQEDDITVLTILRRAAARESATEQIAMVLPARAIS